LKAAFSFYGPPPTKEEEVARINCPVYGFYAGSDNRIDSQIPAVTELMKKAGKTYEPVTYEGAGHGFMRAGDDPNPPKATGDEAKDKSAAEMYAANKKARDEAWARWKDLLKKI
jgi:carboxymethylenebutenolidase